MTILETLMTRLVVRRPPEAGLSGWPRSNPVRQHRDIDDEYGAPEGMLPTSLIESLRASDATGRPDNRPTR